MIEIKVCIGSSCFLKNSPEIVEFLKNKVEKESLDDQIILSGSFCAGKCNRNGVTIIVDDCVYPGITPMTIEKFWEEVIAPKLK